LRWFVSKISSGKDLKKKSARRWSVTKLNFKLRVLTRKKSMEATKSVFVSYVLSKPRMSVAQVLEVNSARDELRTCVLRHRGMERVGVPPFKSGDFLPNRLLCPRWLAPPQPVHKIRWHCSDVGYVICRFKKKCTCLQGCQIFLETYQNGKNIHTQWPQIYQMAVKYNICPYIIHNFLFQGLPKYTKIGICGMKYTIWQPCILTWPLYKIGKKF
jgi:hypothetical protein